MIREQTATHLERANAWVALGHRNRRLFRAMAKKYPHTPASTILTDLVRLTPGEEGKWFAAAKEARLFDEAIALAKASPRDPRTLTRAARDFAEKRPLFATEAGLTALQWLVQGHGYEITSADVWAACSHTLHAARNAGQGEQVRARIQLLVDAAQGTNDMVVDTVGRCMRHEPKTPPCRPTSRGPIIALPRTHVVR